MRNLILMFVLFSTCLNAQESVNSSGADISGSGGKVSYSVGQVLYSSHSGSSGTVSQGVQQPYEIFVLSVTDEGISVELNVYPNPVQNFLRLDLGTINPEGISYQLFDANGRQLKYAMLTAAIEQIEFENLASGIYFLRVSNEQKTIKSFKISKF